MTVEGNGFADEIMREGRTLTLQGFRTMVSNERGKNTDTSGLPNSGNL